MLRRMSVADAPLPAPAALEPAASLFKALASPVRLAVVVELEAGPRCVHELSGALAGAGRTVSQPLLSQHLKVLRDLGLVSSTRRATEVTYELVDSRVARMVAEAVRQAGARPGDGERGLSDGR